MRKAMGWLMAVLVLMAGFGLAQQRVLRLDNSAPGELDPHKGNDYSGSILAYNIYDTLVMPDPQSGVKPHLASRWTASNGGKTYTFNLRPNVRFHDGSLFDADAVIFTARAERKDPCEEMRAMMQKKK